MTHSVLFVPPLHGKFYPLCCPLSLRILTHSLTHLNTGHVTVHNILFNQLFSEYPTPFFLLFPIFHDTIQEESVHCFCLTLCEPFAHIHAEETLESQFRRGQFFLVLIHDRMPHSSLDLSDLSDCQWQLIPKKLSDCIVGRDHVIIV